MKQSKHTLEQIFQAQVDNLSLTLQPFTIVKYQYVARYQPHRKKRSFCVMV